MCVSSKITPVWGRTVGAATTNISTHEASRADHDDSSALAYGVTGLRVVFAIDRARRVTVSHVGFGSEGFIERMREAIESGGREQRKQTAPPHA